MSEVYAIDVLGWRRIIAILAAAAEIRYWRIVQSWQELRDRIDWPDPPPPELRVMSMEMEAFAELSKLWDIPYMRVHVDPAPLVAAARKSCEENLQFLDELEERLGKVVK
jgi:hypothetical protein